MLDSRNLLDAMTEIDDEYLQSAEAFQNDKLQNEEKIIRFPTKAKKWAAVAAATVLLVGTGAYGAEELVKQLQVSTYDNIGELMEKEGIDPWVSSIPVAESTFDESVFKELTPAESLIDILLFADDEAAEKYVMEEGTNDTVWLRKISGIEKYVSGEEYGYYEAYEYEKLSAVFLEKNLQFDMSYIEENYATVAGEYGCDYLYENEAKTSCLQYRMFSGYMNKNGHYISIEYAVDNVNKNESPYLFFQGEKNVRYYITTDGVTVFLRQGAGTEGGQLVTAEVYTEYGHLHINMYGEFEQEEIERVLNSLKIAEGMGIDVE